VAEPRQCGSDAEMPDGIVAIELNAATQPSNSLGIGVEMHFRNSDEVNPPKGP